MSDAPRVSAEVSPAGRWCWWVQVDRHMPGQWIGLTLRTRRVFGSRARADRLALRWCRRELARLQRLAAETHTVQP